MRYAALPAIVTAVCLLLSATAALRAAEKSSSSPPTPSPATLPAETSEQRDARMNWWRDARFGMFIHWGLYAIPAGEWKGQAIAGIGEWIMYRARVPVAEYEQLA